MPSRSCSSVVEHEVPIHLPQTLAVLLSHWSSTLRREIKYLSRGTPRCSCCSMLIAMLISPGTVCSPERTRCHCHWLWYWRHVHSCFNGPSWQACAGCRAGRQDQAACALTLSQHDQIGGCCHTFHDKGYEFDVGIHYIGEMRHNTSLKFLLDQISEGQVQFAVII